MRLAILAVLTAGALATAGSASAASSPETDRYVPLDVEATWSADGTGIRCFAEGECVTQHDGNHSAFSQVWSLQPAAEVRVDQEHSHIGSDKATVSCPTDRPPEEHPSKPGGQLELNVKPGQGTFNARLAIGCAEIYARLREFGAPTAVTIHRDLSADEVERDIRISEDGSKTYTGTSEDGFDWTIVVKWHVKARYVTECTGITRYHGDGFTREWGKAPFCLSGQGTSSYECGVQAARKGTVTCGRAKFAPLHDVLCSHVTRGEIAGLLGSPARTYSDHPVTYCALQGRRGQVLAYRSEDEVVRKPAAQEISFAKLLAADGYARYKLMHTASRGRVLQVIGSRPWVANWYGYRKRQSLWLAGVPGDTLQQKIAAGIARVAARMLARL
jgi:hypothetical protein